MAPGLIVAPPTMVPTVVLELVKLRVTGLRPPRRACEVAKFSVIGSSRPVLTSREVFPEATVVEKFPVSVTIADGTSVTVPVPSVKLVALAVTVALPLLVSP